RGGRMVVLSGLAVAVSIGALAVATVGGASVEPDRPDLEPALRVLSRVGTQDDLPPDFLAARIEEQGDVDIASLRRLAQVPDRYVAAGRSADGSEICQVVALGATEDSYRAGAACIAPGE